jgi:MinD superfamily P-loop ATPase
MERVLATARHFNIPAVVCINKYDINEENTEMIESTCRDKNVQVVGKIQYDRCVTEAMIHLKSVVEYSANNVSGEVVAMWDRIICILEGNTVRAATHC